MAAGQYMASILDQTPSDVKCLGLEDPVHQNQNVEAVKDVANNYTRSGEEKPACLNCQRQGDPCDYSVRLNWGGRTKRMSIDSPNSQSSGYGGARFRSPLQQAPLQMDFSSLTPEELTSPRAISPMGLFESPGLGSSSEGMVSPGQLESQFSTTWAEQSPPLTTSVSSAPLLQYHFGQQNFETQSYLGSMDQPSGLRSLSAFAFHTNPVSQPVSYLRHSVDDSNHSSDPSIFHSRGEGHLSRESHDDQGVYLGAGSGTEQNGSSHSPQDSSGLPSMLFDPHRVSIVESDAASSPRLCDATSNISSVHDHHNELTLDHQVLGESNHEADHTSHESSMAQNKWQTYLNNVTDNYGLDSGRPDQDLTFNNDHAAVDINYALDLISSRWRNEEPAQSQASQPDPEPQVQFCSGYYASPVPINVPRYLSPLPSSLLANPINLMYFHHFLNHTARMLVPHNCDNNPFISVLPSMAIYDSNLLNLLLAYSASHRARYLGHPEPANRIAHWVSNVFPTLRMALESSNEDITDSHLATAIMLLSLKIVSPGTFEVPITWKTHLKLARDLFLSRSERMAQPGNRIGALFARWLGYLDTMGALSCREAGPPLMIYHSILTACSAPDGHDEFGVDCFTGFTPRTGVFLIRLAQLVQECDNQRFDEMGNFRHDWHASAEMVLEGQSLLGDIDDEISISEGAHTSPVHHHGLESSDMIAMEEAFRFAGILHLHRRVLGSSPESFPVKEVLRKLIDALGRMRPGAATELRMQRSSSKNKLLDRFFVLESSGMKQIQNARQLMQECWDRNLPWIALASGQFLG
ncbi:Aflatoxin biosynthesis regulatory protein [Penicillium cf. griseofulvum]|nr:Aflatoxin biosynthesis regulatory protein [Penicillium cf. griseofulvum]